MIKINLSNIKKEYESYDGKREKLIKQSRDVLKAAKQLTYSLHRGNTSESSKAEIQAKKEFDKLLLIKDTHEKLQFEGSLNEASEEYAESMLYADFSNKKPLRTHEELLINQDQYIGALADLSGELVRKAASLVIKKKYDDVEEIYEFVSNLYKELLQFNFRNGMLRKKSDSVRWNMTKIEDLLYDIAIKAKN
jgi:predicted translin family RNA/ssDNA-binding protein